MKDLTVVIPAWDGYVDLVPSLVARLRADLPDADVVVVDNCSRTPLPPGEARIVCTPARMTVGSARNVGLRAARTPFVAFVDADQVPLPGALRELRDRLSARPTALVASGRVIAWHPLATRAIAMRLPTRPAYALTRLPSLFALANLARLQFPVVGTAVMRTEAVLDAGGFSDLDYGEDWGLAATLALRGRVLLGSRPVALYQVHPGSLTHRHATAAGRRASLAAVHRRVRDDPALRPPVRLAQPAARALATTILRMRRWRTGDATHYLLRRIGPYPLTPCPMAPIELRPILEPREGPLRC